MRNAKWGTPERFTLPRRSRSVPAEVRGDVERDPAAVRAPRDPDAEVVVDPSEQVGPVRGTVRPHHERAVGGDPAHGEVLADVGPAVAVPADARGPGRAVGG